MNKVQQKAILEMFDNIEQLSADARSKICRYDYDLEVELVSIKNWVNFIKRTLKKYTGGEK